MLAADGELVVGRRAGDHARAECLPDLNRRDADPAGGAEHEQRLAGFQLAAIAQPEIRRRVGEPERGRLREIHSGRQRQQPPRFGFHFFRERAVRRDCHHAIAGLESIHAVARRFDDARDFATGREGERRLDLILVLDDQDVGEIHARGLHRNHDFAGTRRRRLDVFDDERLGRSVGFAENGFHFVVAIALSFQRSHARR